MEPVWRIKMLGVFRLAGPDGHAVRLPTHKSAALLARLAYFSGRPQPREDLALIFWPDADRSAARVSLRQALSMLRGVLEPPGVEPGAVLVANRESAQVRTDAVSTDVGELLDHLSVARGAPDEAARIERLNRAVDLYSGDLLPGWSELWVLGERRRLANLVIGALTELAQSSLKPAAAVAYAERAIRVDPLREESYGLAMRLCLGAGNALAALRWFQVAEDALRNELDALPGDELQALVRSARAAVAAGGQGRASNLMAEESGTGESGAAPPCAGDGEAASAPAADVALAGGEVAASELQQVGPSPVAAQTAANAASGAGSAGLPASRSGRSRGVAVWAAAATTALLILLGTLPILLRAARRGPRTAAVVRPHAPTSAAVAAISPSPRPGKQPERVAAIAAGPTHARGPGRLDRARPVSRNKAGSPTAAPANHAGARLRAAGPAAPKGTGATHPPLHAASPVVRIPKPESPTGAASETPGQARKPGEAPHENLPPHAVWAAAYHNKPGDWDSEARDMAVDAAGNIYITGFIQTDAHDADYLTLKYGPNGQLLWEQRYNGPGNDVDRSYSLALDTDGSIYVTGDSAGKSGRGSQRLNDLDITTIKYSSTGRPLWVRRYDGPAHGQDNGYKVRTDGHGHIYVLGRSWNHDVPPGDPRWDLVVIQYSRSGIENWVERAPLPGSKDEVNDMVVDPSGASAAVSAGKQTYVFRYSTAGKELWRGWVTAPPGYQTTARYMAEDGSGDTLVVAQASRQVGATMQSNVLVAKFAPGGALLWECEPDGWYSGFQSISPDGVTVDSSGSIVVCSTIANWQRPSTVVVLSIHPDGAIYRVGWYSSRVAGGSGAAAIACGPRNMVFVSGASSYPADNPGAPVGVAEEYATVQFDELLNRREVYRYARGTVPLCEPSCVAMDGQSDFVVTGRCNFGRAWSIVTVKYRW